MCHSKTIVWQGKACQHFQINPRQYLLISSSRCCVDLFQNNVHALHKGCWQKAA